MQNGGPLGAGPARYWAFPNAAGTVGFISAMSNHFCESCNRLRLTADGTIRPCLFSDAEYPVREALRPAMKTRSAHDYRDAIARKPRQHDDIDGTQRFMSQIGGLFPMTTRTPDKPERPRTLGREVHEKYPAAVVGEQPELTLVEGGEHGGASSPAEAGRTTSTPVSPGERDAYRNDLTHVDEHGDVRMVDVGDKQVTKRVAIAEGTILMHPETQAMVLEDRAKKGDVLRMRARRRHHGE